MAGNIQDSNEIVNWHNLKIYNSTIRNVNADDGGLVQYSASAVKFDFINTQFLNVSARIGGLARISSQSTYNNSIINFDNVTFINKAISGSKTCSPCVIGLSSLSARNLITIHNSRFSADYEQI